MMRFLCSQPKHHFLVNNVKLNIFWQFCLFLPASSFIYLIRKLVGEVSGWSIICIPTLSLIAKNSVHTPTLHNYTDTHHGRSYPPPKQRVVGQFCYPFNTCSNKIWWNFYKPIVALISNSIPAEHFLRPFKYSLRNTKQFKLSSSLPPWNNLKTTRRYIHATLFL